MNISSIQNLRCTEALQWLFRNLAKLLVICNRGRSRRGEGDAGVCPSTPWELHGKGDRQSYSRA